MIWTFFQQTLNSKYKKLNLRTHSKKGHMGDNPILDSQKSKSKILKSVNDLSMKGIFVNLLSSNFLKTFRNLRMFN
ncbi:hypothetical protein GCM10025861_22380 [Methanobacterium petrolearium]|nr:hypothetical protein GCM10025861_22380 [Methanobacterium petrolearium]